MARVYSDEPRGVLLLVLTERLAGTAGDDGHRWASGRGVPQGDPDRANSCGLSTTLVEATYSSSPV
jgi:hypothetical protein